MTANRALTFSHLGSTLRTYFEAVWDEVLVPLGGASSNPDNRHSFLYAHLRADPPCTEFRFQGHFGFGGKVRTDGLLRCRMDYYPENKSATRDEQQAAVNAKLAELWTQYLSLRLPGAPTPA